MGTVTGGAISLDYTRMSGNYIAPATVPANPAHVTATLKSNRKSLSKDITITGNSNPNDPTVAVTPAAVTLEPGATQSFVAAVMNNGNPVAGGVMWEAGTYGGGSFVHLLTDGMIKGDGTYTAPYDPPDNRVVVVNAYYGSASVPKTGYAIVTLADPAEDPNHRLNGQYAFSFHDFQHLSTAFGTFVADGHGSLTGTMDLVSPKGRSAHRHSLEHIPLMPTAACKRPSLTPCCWPNVQPTDLANVGLGQPSIRGHQRIDGDADWNHREAGHDCVQQRLTPG